MPVFPGIYNDRPDRAQSDVFALVVAANSVGDWSGGSAQARFEPSVRIVRRIIPLFACDTRELSEHICSENKFNRSSCTLWCAENFLEIQRM
jgi:hypothetical protein